MPKGGASSLTPVYAGLQEDLDAFLKAYMEMESIRFTDYKKLFEHRGMIQLLSGRTNSAEIIEYNECLLVYCLQYMKKFVCQGVPRCLKERLFGLYSLYTFYYVQQDNHVVKVRMDPDASSQFRKLAELVFQERILDAYMVCLKLMEDKAIKHVAFIKIHDPVNFKRFYTDEKVTGVNVKTNLNDPLSSVKSINESREFLKLGYIHTEYARSKQRTGFDGCQLVNVPKKVDEILVQESRKMSMNYSGVDEIINTDHSSEQLASRGMLRSSTKEQAYSSDLKLTRSRRHRSATPLDVTSDTFEFEENFSCEIRDIKKIKKELPAESSKKNRRRRSVSPPGVPVEPSSPEEKTVERKYRLRNNTPISKVDLDDSLVSSPTSQLSEVEHEEYSPAHKKPKRSMTPEIETRKLRKSVKLEVMEMNSYEGVTMPKSIIKSNKVNAVVKAERRVAFRENNDGELDTTVHEIPKESSCEDVFEKVKKIKQETEPMFFLPQSDTEQQSDRNNTHDELFDDTDMFKPLEAEEPDDVNMNDDDLLMFEDSDDEMMIVDEM